MDRRDALAVGHRETRMIGDAESTVVERHDVLAVV